MNTGKFCKICCDNGKSASEYKSHNIRERGVVMCPVLKETVCKYCKTKGHMMSHCVALKEKKGHVLATDVKSKKSVLHTHSKPAQRKASLPCNAFDALFLESDDESEIEDEVESKTKTWAHVAADACAADVCATTNVCAPMFRHQMKQYKSWADYSSDSSDDETW